jgi:hypothetical protein
MGDGRVSLSLDPSYGGRILASAVLEFSSGFLSHHFWMVAKVAAFLEAHSVVLIPKIISVGLA